MQCAFDTLSEWIEWFLSRWWGAGLYLLLTALSFVPWGWDGPDRWVTQTNSAILVLLVGGARRSMKAVHVKLDDIDPRDDLNRIEELTEDEIEARRVDRAS